VLAYTSPVVNERLYAQNLTQAQANQSLHAQNLTRCKPTNARLVSFRREHPFRQPALVGISCTVALFRAVRHFLATPMADQISGGIEIEVVDSTGVVSRIRTSRRPNSYSIQTVGGPADRAICRNQSGEGRLASHWSGHGVGSPVATLVQSSNAGLAGTQVWRITLNRSFKAFLIETSRRPSSFNRKAELFRDECPVYNAQPTNTTQRISSSQAQTTRCRYSPACIANPTLDKW